MMRVDALAYPQVQGAGLNSPRANDRGKLRMDSMRGLRLQNSSPPGIFRRSYRLSGSLHRTRFKTTLAVVRVKHLLGEEKPNGGR